MRHSARFAFGVIALAFGLLLLAWYRRPVHQARLIGLDWQSTLVRSTCTRSLRELWCSTDSRPMAEPHDYATVQLDPVRRSVLRFSRNWATRDSLRWRRIIDSIHASLLARRALPLPCDSSETRFTVAQAWDVGAGEARLYAAKVPAGPYRPEDWFVSLQLVRRASAGCGPSARYVRLTPAQEIRRWEEWIAQQIGL